MKLFTLFLLVLLGCSGCSQRAATSPTLITSLPSESRGAQTTRLREGLKTVTVADGVSKTEAELIAECYFHQNVGCGGFTGIRDGGEFWIVDGAFGYAAKPIQGFHISKATGRITSPIRPSYATPFKMFRKPNYALQRL